jgi:SAM-dependent methyltransferase
VVAGDIVRNHPYDGSQDFKTISVTQEQNNMAERAHDWHQHYATGQPPWDSGTPSLEMQRVIAEYNVAPQRTLEVGCGTGTNAVWLAQQGFQVTAVDLVPLAIERAIARAKATGVKVDFLAANLLDSAAIGKLVANGPYPFVFDRGVYHCLREENCLAFRDGISRLTATRSMYLLLAGNANDPSPPRQGPPRVKAEEMLAELGPLFELVQLREFHFDGVTVDGTALNPLAWSALWRRK